MVYSFTLFSILPVKLNANRVVIGTLRGFDQFMNLVVDNTVEVNGNEKNDIGMVVSKPFGMRSFLGFLFHRDGLFGTAPTPKYNSKS